MRINENLESVGRQFGEDGKSLENERFVVLSSLGRKKVRSEAIRMAKGI